MPVPIRIIKEGIAILLNLLPTLIINCSLSSKDVDIVFRSGDMTAPINKDPPTQIAAETRCIQVIIACSIVMVNRCCSNKYYLFGC